MGKEEDKIMRLLKKFKNDISKKIKLEQFILFGSRASGEPKEYSDIDLLLISKDFQGQKYHKRSPRLYLLWDYDYDIDILCLTPDELKKKQKQIGIIREAVNKGILI
jgi:predicted nucleotidyltransferase